MAIFLLASPVIYPADQKVRLLSKQLYEFKRLMIDLLVNSQGFFAGENNWISDYQNINQGSPEQVNLRQLAKNLHQ